MNIKLLIAIIASLFFVSVAFAQVTNVTNSTNETNQIPGSNGTIGNETPGPSNNTGGNITVPANETPDVGANSTNDTVENPGTLPSSPLWGIDVALDRLRYLLTFDKAEKTRIGLEIAQERLAEIKAAADSGDIKSIEKAQVVHNEFIGKVKEQFQFTTSDNQSVEFKQMIKIGEDAEKYRLKVTTDLQKIDVKIKTQGNLTTEQQASIDSILSQVQNTTNDIKVKIEAKDGKFEIKIKEERKEDLDEETEQEIEIEVENEDDNKDDKKSSTNNDDSTKSDSGSSSGNSGSSNSKSSDSGKGKSESNNNDGDDN